MTTTCHRSFRGTSRFLRNTVQAEAWVGETSRYLVRADIDMGAVLTVLPFEIRETNGGRFLWNAPFGTHAIKTDAKIDNLEHACVALKQWALAIIRNER